MNILQRDFMEAAKQEVFARAAKLYAHNPHMLNEIMESARALLRGLDAFAESFEDDSGVDVDGYSS